MKKENFYLKGIIMTNNEMTLKDYLSLSKTLILKYGRGYKQKLIQDENAIGEVAFSIMRADQIYNPGKNTKPSTWRIKQAIYKILHLIKEIRDQSHIVSLDQYMNGNGHKLDFTEEPPILENDCEDIIETNKGILTEKQTQYLNLIYKDGFSQKEIAQQLGVTKQAVSFSLKRAERKLKRYGVFK
jgi:RNA polymerase sigma factor (sigma-70 family)